MTRRVRGSLTAKLFIISAVLLAASCMMTYALIAYMMPNSYRSALTEGLAEKVDALIVRLEQEPLADAAPLIEQFAQETRTEVQIIDVETDESLMGDARSVELLYDGMLISIATVWDTENGAGEATVRENTADAPDASNSATDSAVSSVAIVSDSDAPTLGYSVRFADSSKPYMLYVYDSMHAVNDAAEALRKILPLLVLAILAISLLGALLYSRTITRPIVQISRLSMRLASLDFTWAYTSARTDEIGVLGRNLNALASRLSHTLEALHGANRALRGEMAHEQSLRRQRSALFSAVSHELKTPITIIKGQLEGMLGNVGVYADRDRTLARALAVSESMEGLVREILALSKSEDTLEAVKPEPLDLGDLLRARLAAHAELFSQRGIQVAVHTERARILADRQHMDKVLDNLLSNAALHAPLGATVWAAARLDGRHVCLTLENSGAHIPQEALPRLFEAFYRVDASRNRQTGGTGLGLYLVKTLLDRYEASYSLENTARGVLFRARFPLANGEPTRG